MKFLTTNEFFYNIDEKVNCFFSFFLMNEVLYSVHRRHRLFSFDNWPQKESENFSQIILIRYKDKNPNDVLSEEVICNGNDPRVISNGNSAYVLSQGALHSGIIYTLTILPEKKNIIIKLGKGAKPGKNWQPIIKDNELYIIDSISPFRINKIDLDTGVIRKEKQFDTDFALKAIHDNYAILRGGSNGIILEDVIFGWGHATINSYTHIPYVWEYSDRGLTTTFVNLYSVFKDKGYNIVDPASFFEWDEENYALSLSCSQRDWFHPQWFLNALILINKKEFLKKRMELQSLENEIQHRSIFFHATELDSLIDSTYSNGGRFSNGKKGCLVCGPSKEIDISNKWTVELCYSSVNRQSKEVGVFDILLTIDGIDTRVAITKLYGTNGKSIKLKLTFDKKNENNKALIQTRVFTKKRVSVTAYFFELTNE